MITPTDDDKRQPRRSLTPPASRSQKRSGAYRAGQAIDDAVFGPIDTFNAARLGYGAAKKAVSDTVDTASTATGDFFRGLTGMGPRRDQSGADPQTAGLPRPPGQMVRDYDEVDHGTDLVGAEPPATEPAADPAPGRPAPADDSGTPAGDTRPGTATMAVRRTPALTQPPAGGGSRQGDGEPHPEDFGRLARVASPTTLPTGRRRRLQGPPAFRPGGLDTEQLDQRADQLRRRASNVPAIDEPLPQFLQQLGETRQAQGQLKSLEDLRGQIAEARQRAQGDWLDFQGEKLRVTTDREGNRLDYRADLAGTEAEREGNYLDYDADMAQTWADARAAAADRNDGRYAVEHLERFDEQNRPVHVEALPVEAPPQTWSQAKAALLGATELLAGALREAEGLAPSDTTDTLTARITQARATLFVVTAQEPPVSWNAFRDMLWGIETLIAQAEDLTRKPHHHRWAA